MNKNYKIEKKKRQMSEASFYSFLTRALWNFYLQCPVNVESWEMVLCFYAE
jgi:hypothetical protein